ERSPAAAAPDVVDVHLQPRMPLGDPAENRHGAAGHEQSQPQVRLLARFPEPVERTVGDPRLLVRIAEAVAESEHGGRAFAPVRDDVLSVRAREIEMAEDAEPVGVPPGGFYCISIDSLAERAWRMNHRAVDARRLHLGQRLLVRVRGVLAMMRAHLP